MEDKEYEVKRFATYSGHIIVPGRMIGKKVKVIEIGREGFESTD